MGICGVNLQQTSSSLKSIPFAIHFKKKKGSGVFPHFQDCTYDCMYGTVHRYGMRPSKSAAVQKSNAKKDLDISVHLM